MIVSTLLPIFFLYFVLLSGYCSEVLNCGLQRYMHNGMFFKHLMIFLSIYIFTFVLNWYTFDSLQINPVSDLTLEETTQSDEPKEEIITKEVNFNIKTAMAKVKYVVKLVCSKFSYLYYLFTDNKIRSS